MIPEKDKQFHDLLFTAKASYKKLIEENQQLKQHIVSIKENKKPRKQEPTIEEHKSFYYHK